MVPTKVMTASKTIEILRNLFSSYGLPETIVSDNGSIHRSQWNPSCIGSTIPSCFKWSRSSSKNGTSQTSFGRERDPWKLRTSLIQFLKRPLRNLFTLLKPNLAKRVEKQQENQVKYQANNRCSRELRVNQMVRVRNYHGGKEKWVLGTIVKKLGPRTFQVRVQGELRMCHLDQLIASAEKPYEEIEDDLGEWLPSGNSETSCRMSEDSPKVNEDSTVTEDQNSEGLDISSEPTIAEKPVSSQESGGETRRYPQRSRRTPERLTYA